MRQPSRPAHGTRTRTRIQALPFAGLGFDLSSVVARGQAMAWLPVRAVNPPASRGPRIPAVRDVPVLSGFDLLLRLGREIRGR